MIPTYEQLESANSRLNCFAHIRSASDLLAPFGGADVTAKAARSGIRAPVGFSFAVKDNIRTPVRIPSGGTRAEFSSLYPSKDDTGALASLPSPVIEKLWEVGAIEVGSTNLDELAFGVTGKSALFGDCRNPLDLARATGGSSSGSAAAVAAGLVDFAIGTDTGGSVRLPASWCGVFGYKPTTGLLSTIGALPLAPTMDCLGFLSADIETLISVVKSIGIDVPGPIGNRSIRIGVPREIYEARSFSSSISTSLHAPFHRATVTAQGMGHQIVKLGDLFLDRANQITDTITPFEAARTYAREPFFSQVEPSTRRRLEFGLSLESTAYQAALRERTELVSEVDSLIAGIDILMLPVVDVGPPTFLEIEGDELPSPYVPRTLLRYCRPFNLLGYPAISVPVGTDVNGLPLAIQLVAGRAKDGRLLRIAQSFANALPAASPRVE